jgi:hypothetical protein
MLVYAKMIRKKWLSRRANKVSCNGPSLPEHQAMKMSGGAEHS